VRDPLRVIGSFLGIGLFRDPLSKGADGAFITRHFEFTGDEIGDAMRYYVEWNARCERVPSDRYLRYRLEDIDASLLRRIANFLDRPISDEAIQAALEAVARDFNTRYSQKPLSWSDLPAGPAREALEAAALRYGYSVEKPASRRGILRTLWPRRPRTEAVPSSSSL
jgi:hypothetical protein